MSSTSLPRKKSLIRVPNITFKFIIKTLQTYYCIADHDNICCRKLGWEAIPGEGHSSAILRGKIYGALVSFDDGKTHDEAMHRFQAYVRDRKTTLFSADTKKVTTIVSRLSSSFGDL